MVAVVILGMVSRDPSTGTGSWPPLATGALLATCYLLAPVVRWAVSLPRRSGETRWPDGAHAFAVLSVLARVQWMHPVRLAELTGMSVEQCHAWVGAGTSRGLVVPAARRVILTRHPEITAAGLDRLDGWTSELARRAAGAQPWTDPTAPTSADVMVDRSSSEVT